MLICQSDSNSVASCLLDIGESARVSGLLDSGASGLLDSGVSGLLDFGVSGGVIGSVSGLLDSGEIDILNSANDLHPKTVT